MNRISVPFVYLDSSAFLRSDIDPKVLTRKEGQKGKKRFFLSLEKLILLSEQEDIYYKNICSLINNKIISKVITCETINRTICNNDYQKIFLFGKKPGNLGYGSSKQWILWGEEISHSSFYEAAMAIADAHCVVIDENVISLNVVKTLMNYITSKCSVFIVGNKVYNNIGDIDMIPMSPVKFIEELTIQIK